MNCGFNATCPLICTVDILEKLKLIGAVHEVFIDFNEDYNSGKFAHILFQFDKLLKFVKLIKTC
jgi:hypothetical protein